MTSYPAQSVGQLHCTQRLLEDTALLRLVSGTLQQQLAVPPAVHILQQPCQLEGRLCSLACNRFLCPAVLHSLPAAPPHRSTKEEPTSHCTEPMAPSLPRALLSLCAASPRLHRCCCGEEAEEEEEVNTAPAPATPTAAATVAAARLPAAREELSLVAPRTVVKALLMVVRGKGGTN